MAAARLGDVRKFPFVDPPDPRAITDGVKAPRRAERLRGRPPHRDRRQMARPARRPAHRPDDHRVGQAGMRPRDPHHGGRAVHQDPRERPTDKQQAGRHRAPPLRAARVRLPGLRGALGLPRPSGSASWSGSAFRRLCRAEYLNYLRVREWQDLHGQLASLTRDLGTHTKTSSSERVRVHTALLRRSVVPGGHEGGAHTRQARAPAGRAGQSAAGARCLSTLGVRGTKFAVFPGSGLARKPPDWIVAAELVETSRLWARTVAAIEPEWVEPVAAHLVKHSYSEPRWSRAQGSAVATEKVTLYGIPQSWPTGPCSCTASTGCWPGSCSSGTPWWRATGRPGTTSSATNAKLIEEAASLEQRARRRGLVVGEDALFRVLRRPRACRRGVRPPLRHLVEDGPPGDARPAHPLA